ncbi:hypothetical protein KXW39_007863 [Aspergillus fumigatus]|nr:hypothetical protein KXX29_008839 [Aspergillus fumigatus]KAH1519631.1 hypothetical protein KXX06_009681 [Aspergillus fumigatus]KAH1578810.1 hypothetical protein KXX17_006047 [Aspergillus fumigatus]KAH1753455.1 hypothetical protein KXX56_008792 [Aspergillus fumigatus]KAH2069015.1 hypothetical protein KXX03_009542 [Aspergillus fumigatus]
MSGRFRVQFHFATLLYFCIGARVAALCPKLKDRAVRGLRYKHIELVLFRTVNAPWKIGYWLDQQWVKNNLDPDNAALGAAIWDCDEPLYAGARSVLLSLMVLMVLRNTTIRAGYCIECLWDDKNDAVNRMRTFNRSTELRNHLEEHIKHRPWPSKCSGCSYISTDQQDYRRHLHDVHHYNKAICVPSEKARKKRSSSEIDEEPIGDANPPKRERRPRKQQRNLRHHRTLVQRI